MTKTEMLKINERQASEIRRLIHEASERLISLNSAHDEIAKLKEELKEKDDVIADLKNFLDEQKASIKRQNQQLTEKELYEKKVKETAPTGVPAIDAAVDRLIKLEAKFEAHENPYIF